jgi:hypothetical protein
LQYAELPGLSASPHRGLQEELSLVEQERGTPLAVSPAGDSPEQAGNQDTAAAALSDAFPPISRSLLQGQLNEVYRGGPLALSPVQLERGRELVVRYAEGIDAFRLALPKEGQGFGVRMADGMLADLAFLEPLAIGCRLEATAAAARLADNRPDEAVPHLETMLRATRVLADEPNATTRVAAANLRANSLAVLRAIATHPEATRSTHEQLLAVLTKQTADWPDDARAWTGDRAGGLVVYELVRDGQYLALLTKDEAQALEERQMLRVTAKAVMRNLDEDELFYLQAMRQLIGSCQLPFAQREPVLRQIRNDLTTREATAGYPLLAGNILLVDFETGHRRQAEDLARCQAWTLALVAALGRTGESLPANPLTGRAYHIERTPLAVTVADIIPGADESCQVPILPERQARAGR